ncbi:MAG: alpha/beta hydrolase [Actinobacteria bacterium]|nr:alpha/beta hydrolase [Actinomycetota bacterium]
MSGHDLTFTTSDAVRLRYDDEGEGRPVVLVHGYTGSRQGWSLQRRPLLDAGFRVVALDLRGHGSSDAPDHGQRMSRLGTDLRELMDHLGLDDACVVGHSMGASVVWAMLSVHGLRGITALVTIDQSPRIVNDETWSYGVRKVAWDNLWESVHFTFPWGEPQLEPAPPAHVAAAVGSDLGSFMTFDHARVRRLFLDHFAADWTDVLPRLDVPVWVTTGGLSPFYDLEGMQWLASAMPRAELTVFEQSGHCPHWNESDAFNSGLLDFLAGPAAR